jgi:uncharacterized protein YjbI with pentapeptide repeats
VKVIKPQKLALLTRSFEFGKDFFLSVAVLFFFPFDAPRKPLSEVDLWKFVPGELGKDAALDVCMPKKRAEFLVTGRACPRGGQPAIACAPRAQVGPIEKTLWAVGSRTWKLGAPSSAEPFTEMPITWENAFGGPGFKPNPLGKGIDKVKTERGEVRPLPNIEDPKRLVKSPRDKPPPAGFGPYDLTWPQRFKKAGTYDKTWVKERFPGFAADIDWTIFNTAPEDQQMDGAFKGDERFTLDFMHPKKTRLEGELPGAVARCFVNQKTAQGEVFKEIGTKLDTVWLFPHAERGILVFHGLTQVTEDDACDVLQIVTAFEEMGVPRPVEHYKRVLAERLDREKGVIAALRDGDLMPAWPLASEAAQGDEMAALVTENLLQKNLRKKAQRQVEEQRALLVSFGLDPDAHGVPASLAPEETPPSLEELPQKVEHLLVEAKKQREAQEQERVTCEEQLRRALVDQGLDPEPTLSALRSPPGGPPRFSAQGELETLRATVEEHKRLGLDVGWLEAMLVDPQLEVRLGNAERRVLDAYRSSVHHGQPAGARDAEASRRAREAVLAAVRAGESFEGRDLTGADLSGIQIPGANLAGAFMEGVKLTGADLAGADLSGVVLARADLTKVNLRGAKLQKANLGSAVLREAQADGADLTEAILSKADLTGARLVGALLAKADLSEATLGGADLSGVKAPGLILLKTDISGLRFGKADLSGCNFLEVTAEGTDFSEACLESAVFLGARGGGASFRGAKLGNLRLVQDCCFEKADFRGANLEGANLRGTKLGECDFTRARLVGADLSECDLKRARLTCVVARDARFVKADLGDAVLAGADLMNAIFQKALIPGANFRGASLYQADLSRVLADDRFSLAGANVKKVRVDPKRVR